MINRNASASALGWEFQVNAAIVLMLENIKNAKNVRVEGADEDIEITLQDHTKIYAQVKFVEKPDDTSHVLDKLNKALETLCDAAKNNDGCLFTYITNSFNPFNNLKTIGFFTGRTHLYFDELPDVAQEKINNILKQRGYDELDVKKMDVRVIPFYGSDIKNRHKEIQAYINEFFSDVNLDLQSISIEIMRIWQELFFHNATQGNTSISISKKKMIWPLIVLVVDNVGANDYKKDFNDDELGEISRKYKKIIDINTMRYDTITHILAGFKKSKKAKAKFVAENWKDYLHIVHGIEAEDEIKESLVKIILYRVLTQKQYIQDIKRGTNL